MKVLFLCGSLEPGNGVGDYTRRFGSGLINKSHQVHILSLCDKGVTDFINEAQIVDGIEVFVSRIPKESSYQQRLIWTQNILNENRPDWISLQYVPYSYNYKGLPFWLPKFIKKIKGSYQWQIMFHELWVGIDVGADFKSKLIGFLQQIIVKKIIKVLDKPLINTQTNLYKYILSEIGYNSNLLPLFSNISNNNINIRNVTNESKEVCFALFGGIHYGAPVKELITVLKKEINKTNEVSLKFIFIGNSGNALKEWTSVLDSEKIKYDVLGFSTDEEVSISLSNSHYGITTTPYLLVQKSGSVAALLDHKLPVLCVARQWEVSNIEFDKTAEYDNVIHFQEFDFTNFIYEEYKYKNMNSLSSVVDRFVLYVDKSK